MNAIDRINTLRQKVIDGVEITKEESAEAIQLLATARREKLEGAVKKSGPSTIPTDLGSLFTPPKGKS